MNGRLSCTKSAVKGWTCETRERGLPRQSACVLHQAETMLRVNLIEAAGRTAYLAAFHAAQAFIFETTGRIYKRHATVQSEFGRLTRNDARR